MIRRNLTYTERYELFNGNRYLSVDDSTIIQNKATGRITGRFKLEDNGEEQVILSYHNSAATTSLHRIEINSAVGSFRFYYFDGTNSLSFSPITSLLPLDHFVDGLYHTFDITVDGINNKMILDSILYEDTDLLFDLGSKTTSLFSPVTLTSLILGVNSGKFSGSDIGLVTFSNGLISDLIVYDTDLTTPLYTLNTNGTEITASSPTTWIKNVILDLQYNNSNVDISDVPKTITASGTEVYSDGRYGEVLSARDFSGTDRWDTMSNPTQLDIFNISGVVKRVGSTYAAYLMTSLDSTNTTDLLGNMGVVFTGLGLIVVWDNYNGVSYGGGYYPVDIDTWYYVSVNYDSINETVDVYINGKLVQLLHNSNYVGDYTRVQPLGVVDINIGNKSNGGRQTSGLVYNTKIRSYLMSKTEIKAEFKKYPK